MKALIIAGGLGTRLSPLTNGIPKCLVSVNGRPLLGRIVDSLLRQEIRDLVIITGHMEEKLKAYMEIAFPDLSPVYVFNPLFENTKIRYIYAMWLAKEEIDDDSFYIHADAFYDPILIKKLKEFPYSGALINRSYVSEKDFNARVENGLIKEIGVNLNGESAGFCLPVYKLLKKDFSLWMGKINDYVEAKNLDCYAESALNEVTDKINLYPVYFEDEVALEIDDFVDFKKAEESGL